MVFSLEVEHTGEINQRLISATLSKAHRLHLIFTLSVVTGERKTFAEGDSVILG